MAMTMSDDVFVNAYRVIQCAEPAEKCRLALELWQCWQQNSLTIDSDIAPQAIAQPGRPKQPELVHPSRLKKRSFHTAIGRVSLMHAVAHIEFNAIDLACDAVYRYRGLPRDYYADWVRVAADEARHFQMVEAYLLQHGSFYGEFPAHNGLWDMAEKTAGDHLARLAVVPRVLEARGLDVTPSMIQQLEKVGDKSAADILKVIYEEEIGHVAAGSRWFDYLCCQQGLDAQSHFFALVQQYSGAFPRGPFNLEARKQAGFKLSELEQLQIFQAGSKEKAV